MRKTHYCLACLASVLSMTAAQAADADTAPTLGEVTVRSASESEGIRAKDASVGVLGDLPLIETPFSVNVITHELIDKQQAAFIGDVLKNDPSVTVGNVAVPFLLLRGFTVGVDGTLYDGLPGHGGLSDGRAGMQLIDRVEVLKGASAFLTGIGSAGSLGGVVNYVPKFSTAAPQRSVGVGFANRSLWSIDTDLSARFGDDDQFGYRLNVGLRDGEQAVARYDWNQQAASLAFDWRVRPGLVFNLVFDHIDNHIPELPPFYLLVPGVSVPDAPDAKRSAALSWDDFKTESDNIYLRADWAITDAWSLTGQALHNESGRPGTKEARFGQITNAAGDMFLFGGQEVSSNENDSGQVLLHGKLATGSINHRLTFGLAGSKQEARGAFFSYPFLIPSNLYNPVDFPEPADVALDNAITGRVRNSSVLASDTIAFSEQWSALLGARRARMRIENVGAETNEVTKTLPTAALMFKPVPGALVYLNSARGLEQGGVLDPATNTGFLPPRLTKQIEFGAKLDRDGMSYTTALFDMQRPLETFDAGIGQNVQRGQQRHRGIELMATGSMTPVLTIVSGLMLLNARLEGTGGADEGRRAPGVPRVTANLWGEYRIATIPGLAINGGLYHYGKQYLDGANTQAVPSWTRVDVGASYLTRMGGLPAKLLLNIENLADKDYWASANGNILTMGDPLTVKLGARVNF